MDIQKQIFSINVYDKKIGIKADDNHVCVCETAQLPETDRICAVQMAKKKQLRLEKLNNYYFFFWFVVAIQTRQCQYSIRKSVEIV